MRMNHHRFSTTWLAAGLVATAAATVAATVLFVQWQEQPATVSGPAATASQLSGAISANPFARGDASAQHAPVPEPAPAASAPPASPVATLGTGAFRADASGTLLLDDATRMRLDILLASLPKHATQHERQAMEAEAVAGLPPAAAEQATHVLQTYIAYSSAEAELLAAENSSPAARPEETLEKLAALRRRHLGLDIAQALFGAQELQARYGLQLAALEADASLTAQQKLARIEAMQQALPEGATEIHDSLQSSRASLAMEQGVAALRAQGASEAQVRQLREQHVGAEGASSISEMEAHKADWERRQQAFAQQRMQIARMQLSDQQKKERVEALLRTLYSEEELPAARAYLQSQQQAGR